MTYLHLGVFDTPHIHNKTTAEVAESLEHRYGVLQHFYDYKQDAILDAVSERMFDEFEMNSRIEAPIDEIKVMFANFLNLQEAEAVIPKLPSQRALKGIRSRIRSEQDKKDEKKAIVRERKRKEREAVHAGTRRPSLVDTGLYLASFIAWTEPE